MFGHARANTHTHLEGQAPHANPRIISWRPRGEEFTRGWSNLKQQMGGTTTPRLHGLEDIPEDSSCPWAAVVSEPEPELEPEPEPEQQPKAKPKPDQIFRPL